MGRMQFFNQISSYLLSTVLGVAMVFNNNATITLITKRSYAKATMFTITTSKTPPFQNELQY